MKVNRYIFFIFIGLLVSCVEKTPFYSDISTEPDESFGAGDTTYVMLNPVWNADLGLISPVEISIAQDGIIYIADTSSQSILVMDQSGRLESGYDALSNLVTIPIDVDIDEKMNVFYIDGSQRVFRWNHLWNNTGIHSIAVSATFVHGDGSEVNSDYQMENWVGYLNNPEWTMTNIQWETNSSIIDSLLAPHVFYEGSLLKNIYKDNFYQSDQSQFTGLSVLNGEDNAIVVADRGGVDSSDHRVLRIDFEREHLLYLESGNTVWAHSGIFGQTLAQEGTGAGYVNQPVSLDTDESGNIYYTQTGIQYGAHKIRPITTGSYTTYTSVFTEGINDIMELGRFTNPRDIAVDNSQMIYVAHEAEKEIQVFNYNGNFYKKAGITEVAVDTILMINDVAVDTSITIELKDILMSPTAVTVDDRGVIYVCDPEASSIYRFRLSNVLDEDLQPDI